MKTATLTLVGATAIAAATCTIAQTKAEIAGFVPQAKSYLTQGFKDPNAAQFRGLYVTKAGPALILCGEVNAKNGFGAYVGFRRFYAALDDKQIEGATDPDGFSILGSVYCGQKGRPVQ